MKYINYIIIGSLISLIASCEPEFENFEGSTGTANFSKYVAVGNSLTAGFADGALYREAQLVSYPNLLSQQFEKAGSENLFTIPLMPEGVGTGFSDAGLPISRLVLAPTVDCKMETSLGPVRVDPNGGDISILSPANYLTDEAPFNNMGVPGAKIIHIPLTSYGDPSGILAGTANPYYARMATAPGSSSILGDAVSVEATFFSTWIGNNDVLSYCIAGGEGEVNGVGSDDMTPVSVFESTIKSILDSMESNGAEGLVANIPPITSIPFFTTVPAQGLPITSQAQVDALNAGYAQYNTGAGMAGLPGISFSIGANFFVIEDDSPTYTNLGGFRQITADELVLLTVPQDSIKCAGWGSQKPIPKEFILDAEEISNASNRIGDFNTILKSEADNRNLAFADMFTLMQTITKGISYDGATVSSAFVSGGGFSLDGIHLTGKGNAIVANAFIEAINTKYNATIPLINVNEYSGVQFP